MTNTPDTTSRSPSLAVAILMAGESRRLGHPKQHHELDGLTLMERSIGLARRFLSDVAQPAKPIVVSGAYLQQDCRALSKHHLTSAVDHHVNPAWRSGMNTSREVARAATATEGVMILLVDQYRLQINDLQRIYAAWQDQPERPAIATFADTMGPPVILPARLAGTTKRLGNARTPCTGKEQVRLSNPVQVCVPNAEFDLDTAHDATLASDYFNENP